VSHWILSCTTCATRLPGKDELAECLTLAPKIGYRAWGVAGPLFWTPGLVQWADLPRLRRCADEAGLTRCTEVYAAAFPTESVAAAQAVAPLRAQLFEAAMTLGSPLVVMTGRPRREGGLAPTIAGLQALLPLIQDMPVKLALEPHYGSQIQLLEDYDAIFAEITSPQVGITLDSGHFHSAGVDWRRLIARYPERILNFHVKDQRGTQSVPIGAGEVDLRGYLEALHGIDYRGALAVELEVEDLENLPRYTAEAYDYMRQLAQEVAGELPE
jgi:sugar phosphate isomerase/epimerase